MSKEEVERREKLRQEEMKRELEKVKKRRIVSSRRLSPLIVAQDGLCITDIGT